MNFRSLEYFNKVAEEKSIRSAAKKLYISEQSLSESVKRLENEMGVSLLTRSRPFELTEAGKEFYRYSREILDKKKKMETAVKKKAVENGTTVSIMIGPMGLPVFLPELMVAFNREYPEYYVEVNKKMEDEISLLKVDEIGFLPMGENKDLNFVPLFDDCCCVIVSEEQLKKAYGKSWKAHLESAQESGDVFELKDLSFIDWKIDKANYFTETWQKLDEMKFEPELISITDNFDTNLVLCKQGMGALFSMEDMVRRRIGDDDTLKREGLYMVRLNITGSRF
nr:LysR family transcriptional regulator [Eubacterium sp.]